MKRGSEYFSCWYNRLQSALYLLAFLTRGLGDPISGLWMIEKQGIMRESDPILRYVFINYGAITFLGLKVLLTLVFLFIIFLIQKSSKQPVYWTVNGSLIAFIAAGTLSTILNIQAARNEVVFLSPLQVIFLFLLLAWLLMSIGEEIDKQSHTIKRANFDCLLRDIAIILTVLINIFKNKK